MWKPGSDNLTVFSATMSTSSCPWTSVYSYKGHVTRFKHQEFGGLSVQTNFVFFPSHIASFICLSAHSVCVIYLSVKGAFIFMFPAIYLSVERVARLMESGLFRAEELAFKLIVRDGISKQGGVCMVFTGCMLPILPHPPPPTPQHTFSLLTNYPVIIYSKCTRYTRYSLPNVRSNLELQYEKTFINVWNY